MGLARRKNFHMFEESSSLERKKKEQRAAEGSAQKDQRESARQKNSADIISEAFNPIKCMPWKTKNLLDQIEEDHPSHKSTEYAIPEKSAGVSPIGKGALEKTKSKYISLTNIKLDSAAAQSSGADAKKSLLMEEMQGFARKKNITGAGSSLICAVSKDQEGSRFIQKRLDTSTPEESEIIFQEIKKWTGELMRDLFGNYVVQKFLEMGSAEQKREILGAMEESVIPLALHMYGCRVVQKALECKEINKKIVEKIQGHVVELVCDQNGNHVVQKCVESVGADFVAREFEQDVVNLSKHRYGCRVIQRIFENSSDGFMAVNKIIGSAKELIEDQYGNYVIQHILEKGTDRHRRKIIAELIDKIGEYSTHKFASNVMEKCVMCGTSEERKRMVAQLMKTKRSGGAAGDALVQISCDKFGNYVVQRLLEVLEPKERDALVAQLKGGLQELKKSSYAKCILVKITSQDQKSAE